MDQGSIHLDGLRAMLRANRRKAWIRAILTDENRLHFAEVVIGPKPADWSDREWLYEKYCFVAAAIPARQLASWFDPDSEQRIEVGDHRATVPPVVGGHFNWRRRPSLALFMQSHLPWPVRDFDVSLTNPQDVTYAPGFLVGHDCPSFPTLSGAYNAFFRNNYSVNDSQDPPTNQVILRVVDDSAWLGRVRVRPSVLDVRVRGRKAKDTCLELNSAGLQEAAVLDGHGTTTFHLPEGLPADAWVWLKRDQNWLDFRSLGGWAAYRSEGVEIETPDDPAAEIGGLIAQGEGPRLEFKQQLPDSREEKRTVFKTIAAFANSDGGMVLFGVQDDGSILGLPGSIAAHERRVTDLIRDLVTPTPPFRITRHPIGDKDVLALDVGSGSGVLHALVINSNKPEYFVRRGATTFYARPEEVVGKA